MREKQGKIDTLTNQISEQASGLNTQAGALSELHCNVRICWVLFSRIPVMLSNSVLDSEGLIHQCIVFFSAATGATVPVVEIAILGGSVVQIERQERSTRYFRILTPKSLQNSLKIKGNRVETIYKCWFFLGRLPAPQHWINYHSSWVSTRKKHWITCDFESFSGKKHWIFRDLGDDSDRRLVVPKIRLNKKNYTPMDPPFLVLFPRPRAESQQFTSDFWSVIC